MCPQASGRTEVSTGGTGGTVLFLPRQAGFLKSTLKLGQAAAQPLSLVWA